MANGAEHKDGGEDLPSMVAGAPPDSESTGLVIVATLKPVHTMEEARMGVLVEDMIKCNVPAEHIDQRVMSRSQSHRSKSTSHHDSNQKYRAISCHGGIF